MAVLETTVLNTERNEISMMGNRLASSVRLIVAMGGGWTTEDLNRLNVNGQPLPVDPQASAQQTADAGNPMRTQ